MQLTEVNTPGFEPDLLERVGLEQALSTCSVAGVRDPWERGLRLEKAGALYRHAGQPQSAIRAFRAALEAHGGQNSPAVVRIYVSLGGALHAANKPQQALEAWEQGINLLVDRSLTIIAGEGASIPSKPGNSDRGRLADRAVHTRIKELCRLDLTFAILRNNMGVVHAEQGAFQQAIQMFREAVECTPEGARYEHPLRNLSLLKQPRGTTGPNPGGLTPGPARDYSAGDTIAGSYHVLRVFGGAGASGMGVVYLVEEREAPEPFVLKACQTGDPALAASFRREAQVWVGIGSHPNVTKAFWVRELDGQLFVAAEYVRGADVGMGSLAAVVGHDVVPRQLIRWSIQFCSGLAHALARGLVAHRDVKPANLLLTATGDLKLADFGLSKLTPGIARLSNASRAGTSCVGTPPYMAPEQVQAASTDHRCDIYAFGIVLYQLCSGGKYPYAIAQPSTAESYLEAHVSGAVRPLRSPFWPVIQRCLAREPSERWQSPADLVQAVRRVAQSLDLPCPPLVPPQTAGLEDLFAKAQSLVALGKPSEALAAVDAYLSKAPDAFWAWTERGKILMEMNRYVDAEWPTRRSLALDPTNSHAWNNLGIILNRLERYDESCNAYERALECDPLNGGAMMNAAAPLCEVGRTDRAATLLSSALRLVPEKQNLRVNAGNIAGLMLRNRDFRPAEELLRALIETDAGDGMAWHNLGVVLHATARRQEALQCVRTAVEYEPDNADGRILLARLAAEAGLPEEALPQLDCLIDAGQHVTTALCYKAQILANQGRGGAAMRLLEDHLAEFPGEASAWLTLSRLAEAEGDHRVALRAARAYERLLVGEGSKADPRDREWARAQIAKLSRLPGSTSQR